MRFLTGLTAALMLFVPSTASCLADGADDTDITKLNGHFRALYAGAKTELRAHTSPILILANGKMVLLRKGNREEFAYMPAEWSVLKTVDHIGLALFVALTNHTGEKLSDELVSRLQTFKSAILAAQDDFKSFKYSPIVSSGNGESANLSPQKTADRQQLLIDLSLKFIDKILSERFISYPELKAFSRSISKMSVENAYDAVSMEIGAIDSKLSEWRKQMDKDEWDRLYVVVTGSHMARQNERTVHYFLDLFGQKAEGDRVIYNEGANDENSSLDLLVTHILDARIGEAFFGDKMRMHRDMLGDEGSRYLRYHHPH